MPQRRIFSLVLTFFTFSLAASFFASLLSLDTPPLASPTPISWTEPPPRTISASELHHIVEKESRDGSRTLWPLLMKRMSQLIANNASAEPFGIPPERTHESILKDSLNSTSQSHMTISEDGKHIFLTIVDPDTGAELPYGIKRALVRRYCRPLKPMLQHQTEEEGRDWSGLDWKLLWEEVIEGSPAEMVVSPDQKKIGVPFRHLFEEGSSWRVLFIEDDDLSSYQPLDQVEPKTRTVELPGNAWVYAIALLNNGREADMIYTRADDFRTFRSAKLNDTSVTFQAGPLTDQRAHYVETIGIHELYGIGDAIVAIEVVGDSDDVRIEFHRYSNIESLAAGEKEKLERQHAPANSEASLDGVNGDVAEAETGRGDLETETGGGDDGGTGLSDGEGDSDGDLGGVPNDEGSGEGGGGVDAVGATVGEDDVGHAGEVDSTSFDESIGELADAGQELPAVQSSWIRTGRMLKSDYYDIESLLGDSSSEVQALFATSADGKRIFFSFLSVIFCLDYDEESSKYWSSEIVSSGLRTNYRLVHMDATGEVAVFVADDNYVLILERGVDEWDYMIDGDLAEEDWILSLGLVSPDALRSLRIMSVAVLVDAESRVLVVAYEGGYVASFDLQDVSHSYALRSVILTKWKVLVGIASILFYIVWSEVSIRRRMRQTDPRAGTGHNPVIRQEGATAVPPLGGNIAAMAVAQGLLARAHGNTRTGAPITPAPAPAPAPATTTSNTTTTVAVASTDRTTETSPTATATATAEPPVTPAPPTSNSSSDLPGDEQVLGRGSVGRQVQPSIDNPRVADNTVPTTSAPTPVGGGENGDGCPSSVAASTNSAQPPHGDLSRPSANGIRFRGVDSHPLVDMSSPSDQ